MEFKDLPVYRNKEEILKGLRENQAIIVESPTGSGKTTQIPLILLEAGYAVDKMIGITQPRRIAALSVCDFIKKQLNLDNNFCSYKMRFYDTTDLNTRIKIMTDGILLQELKHDPDLQDYSVIMVDEAHERSLNIDFILGLLKNLMKKRPDLKIIISSATINVKSFSRFLNDCRIVSIKSPVYPVSVKYLPPATSGNIDEIIDTIVQIINIKMKIFAKNGFRNNDDILVFLPGEFDIKTCIREIAFRCDYKHLQIYPLYGRLNKEEQEQVFTPTEPEKIKVIVSTNIAETSITIDGIKNVIDSGYAKINFYNQKDFSSALVTEKISRSSAEQRKGRAGRVAPGFCYRLYSQDDFKQRPEYSMEEILRTDLSEVILRMSDLGIFDYENFPFITRPEKNAIASAEKTLNFIGAIDPQRHLTKIGEIMVNFPLAPRHSRVIVEAMMNYPDVMEEILIAVSFLSVRTPFILPVDQEDEARAAHKRFVSKDGDFVAFLDIFNAFSALEGLQKRTDFCQRNFLDLQTMLEIVHVDEQLSEIVSSLGFILSKGGSKEDYLCCLASGLKQYVCMQENKFSYSSLTSSSIYIHPGSAWFQKMPRIILAGEIVSTSRRYARTVSPLTTEILNRISPTLYNDLVQKTQNRNSDDRDDDSDGSPRRKDKGQRKAEKDGRDSNQPSKLIQVYGKSYPSLQLSQKKGKPQVLVMIPFDDLVFLSKAQAKARRHPKNFRGVVMLGNKMIHKGDSLFNIIDLAGKLPENKIPVDLRKERGWTVDGFDSVRNKLDLLGRYAILPNDSQALGFVELETSGNDNFYLNANPDFYDCLTNTSYSLMALKDSIKGDDALNRCYNRIMNILNRL